MSTFKESFHYKAVISYKGTRYLGWQIQNPPDLTVQGEIHKALIKITKSEEVSVLASGRTDAGVHALAQVCRIRCTLDIGNREFTFALNTNLPPDIRILSIERCSKEFHPIKDAQGKEYWYFFSNLDTPNPFQAGIITNFPRALNYEKMKKACELFVGVHDFSAYHCVGSETASFTRQIYYCELLPLRLPLDTLPLLPPSYQLKIRGNGFLKQMVRLIVGAIWGVGLGKLSLEQVEASLQPPPMGEKNKQIAMVAPPEGLYLSQVFYSSPLIDN